MSRPRGGAELGEAAARRLIARSQSQGRLKGPHRVIPAPEPEIELSKILPKVRIFRILRAGRFKPLEGFLRMTADRLEISEDQARLERLRESGLDPSGQSERRLREVFLS